MEYVNQKWFEVVWSLSETPLKFESDEVEAECQEEAEEKIQRLYGTYENNYQEVIISMSTELQD